MKTIGVYTTDFSLYYDIVKILRRRKIGYVSLSSLKKIPSKVGVILTSNKELHDIKSAKVIAADAYESIDHAVDLSLQILLGKDLYSRVYIGIDPGEHPGIAIIGDDILLQKKNVGSPEKVFPIVKNILKQYPATRTIIRIGHGSTTIRNRIINSLIPLKIPIEIVDESKTTASQPSKRHERDSKAAATIASLSGWHGKIRGKLPLEPTHGEIKNIQERSRKLTNGRFTISEKTALKVLKGKISLKEALDLEK